MSDDSLLDRIRERPAMYLGEHSLTALKGFVHGYLTALDVHRFHDANRAAVIPVDFHDWVAYRLHFRESTSGWCGMIKERTRTEAGALKKFFTLLDEHRRRRPHVVAKVSLKRKTYTRRCGDEVEVLQYPRSVSLITYTDDPGFFVVPEGKVEFPGLRFYPAYNWFDDPQIISRVTIVDPNWNYGARRPTRPARSVPRSRRP